MLLIGETEDALALGRPFHAPNDVLYYQLLWMPSLRRPRGSPEFRGFVRNMGFVALWDRYGPPDGSHRGATGEYTWE